jgi:hypothetical protein
MVQRVPIGRKVNKFSFLVVSLSRTETSESSSVVSDQEKKSCKSKRNKIKVVRIPYVVAILVERIDQSATKLAAPKKKLRNPGRRTPRLKNGYSVFV